MRQDENIASTCPHNAALGMSKPLRFRAVSSSLSVIGRAISKQKRGLPAEMNGS